MPTLSLPRREMYSDSEEDDEGKVNDDNDDEEEEGTTHNNTKVQSESDEEGEEEEEEDEDDDEQGANIARLSDVNEEEEENEDSSDGDDAPISSRATRSSTSASRTTRSRSRTSVSTDTSITSPTSTNTKDAPSSRSRSKTRSKTRKVRSQHSEETNNKTIDNNTHVNKTTTNAATQEDSSSSKKRRRKEKAYPTDHFIPIELPPIPTNHHPSEYNPISKYEESVLVPSLTLYDIYRKPRHSSKLIACTLVPDTTSPSSKQSSNKRSKSNYNTSSSSTTIINVPHSLSSEFHCPICLGFMRKTVIVMVCLHRFCGECIQKSLRLSAKKECPQCRVHIPSRRSLRPDTNFDNLIGSVYGKNVDDLQKMEEEKNLKLNKELNMNNEQARSRSKRILQQQRIKMISKKTKSKSTTVEDDDEDDGLDESTMPQDSPAVTRGTSTPTTSTTTPPTRTTSATTPNNNSRMEPNQASILLKNMQQSTLVDFILRKHPRERNVDRLLKEYLRTSQDITMSHLKRFLSQKLCYYQWKQIEIMTSVDDNMIVLDDDITLNQVRCNISDYNPNSLLVLQYRTSDNNAQQSRMGYMSR